MKTLRVEIDALQDLLDNIVAAQEENDGWREAIDAAKADLTALLSGEDAYPTALTLDEVTVTSNNRSDDQALIEIQLADPQQSADVLVSLGMTPAETTAFIGQLQDMVSS
jgi:hypothetical protein